MKIYRTKIKKFTGTGFKEIHKKALNVYRKIEKKSKRRAYVRSAYFNKEKIFIGIFWQHLFDKKDWKDRNRRLKYFEVAIDLICNSKLPPVSKENPNKREELLHRFAGVTAEKDMFYVQIKEDKKTKQKYLISMFPAG